MTRPLGAALAVPALLLACLTGCGKDEKTTLPAPDPTTSTEPSPTDTGPAFTMPSPGDDLGGEVTTRPETDESAKGAEAFSAWALSLLLHTPREDASTDAWLQASGPECEPCRSAAAVWQEQLGKEQVFDYARTPRFLRTVVRAQPQGDGMFVQFEVAVPRSTLSQGTRVVQSSDAERLGYSFSVTWTGEAWQIDDFHVLG